MAANDLRAQTIRALHTVQDRDQAIDRIAALPGIGRLEAARVVDIEMAANRRSHCIQGVKTALIGLAVISSAGLIAALAWAEITATEHVHLILIAGVLVVPFIGLCLVAYGIRLLWSPSPFDNHRFARAELIARHDQVNPIYSAPVHRDAPVIMTSAESAAHGAPTMRTDHLP